MLLQKLPPASLPDPTSYSRILQLPLALFTAADENGLIKSFSGLCLGLWLPGLLEVPLTCSFNGDWQPGSAAPATAAVAGVGGFGQLVQWLLSSLPNLHLTSCPSEGPQLLHHPQILPYVPHHWHTHLQGPPWIWALTLSQLCGFQRLSHPSAGPHLPTFATYILLFLILLWALIFL